MLLKLKARYVSIIIDYVSKVVKGTIVMLDFYFKLKFNDSNTNAGIKYEYSGTCSRN